VILRAGAAVLCAVALVGCGGRGSPGPSGSVSGGIVAGSPARFRAELRALRGRPVVVNYWGSWCDPCKAEMPRLVAAATRYDGRVHFLGVDVQDVTAAARRFVRRYRVPFDSFEDPRKAITLDQHILSVPTTQFFAADGHLALVHLGEIKAGQLREKIGEVLRSRKKG
jgi:thiol-disulfide isomerase/thioredoxin